MFNDRRRGGPYYYYSNWILSREEEDSINNHTRQKAPRRTVPCKSACIDTNCNRRMYEGQAEKKSKVCLGKSREYDPRLKISKTLP